ncbi:hypothetical protein D920_00291 [Enterococcus faecalis 13-SD-W-01]|nr:hypothetical protein D920_00291 [Enterococcus faecalis 13-SD-W-01]
MDFWTERICEVERYTKKHTEEELERILTNFIPYLKKCAEYSHYSARNVDVYIPFEDFYSAYLCSTWQVIEDFCAFDQAEKNFKNMFLRRLFIAEKEVWRLYKKKSGKTTDKKGITYTSGRWHTIQEGADLFAPTFLDESTLIINELLAKYQIVAPEDAQFFSLLMEGYSCAEAVSTLFFEEYNARMRKKIERMKRKFQKYLENENFFLFPVTNEKNLRHI